MSDAKPSHSYFHGLDLIRFGAAVAVTVYHFDAAAHGMAISFWWGWVGVEIFFLLSGAVIANSAEGSGLRAFLVGRVLRLYPAAWACAAINFALLLMRRAPEGLDWIKLLASLTLIPKGGFLAIPGDVLPNLGFLAGAYWTLPIEIAFYAVIALGILFGLSRHLNKLAIGLGIVSGLFLVILSLSVAGVFSAPKLDFEHGILNLTLLRHGVFFAAGMLLARRFRHGLSRGENVALIAFVAFGAIETMVSGARPDHASGGPTGTLAAIAVPALIFLGSALLINFAMSGNAALERRLSPFHGTLRLMGLLTYPLYLIHQNVAMTLRMYMGDAVPTGGFIAIGLILTLVLATGVALIAEPPMRRGLRGLLAEKRPELGSRPS